MDRNLHITAIITVLVLGILESLRSFETANSYGGVSCIDGGHRDSGSEYLTEGSRLAFDGTIVETSVTDFKGITNWRK